jgi:alpha-1,6-mannosyltransferase
MKICDLVQSYCAVSGGVKRYIQEKMRWLEAREEFEHVLIIPGVEDAKRVERRTVVHEVESLPLIGSKGYRMLLDRKQMLKIIEEEKPDIIEVGNAYRPAHVAVEASIKLGIPVVGFYHSDFPRAWGGDLGTIFHSDTLDKVITGFIEDYLVDLYNRMTATITATDNFESMLGQMGVKRIVRIPLGTNTEVFRPMDTKAAVKKELGLDDDVFLMVFIGRFAKMKSIPEILELMKRFNSMDKIHLLMIGNGEFLEEVLDAVEEMPRRITRYDYVTDPDKLAGYYAAADLFINPSMHETFGLVSVEAQSCGTRVLAVRGGGMDATLEGEEDLIMAESREPAELERTVRAFMKQVDTPEKQKARRDRIIENFSLDTSYTRITALYKHLAAGKAVRDFTLP